MNDSSRKKPEPLVITTDPKQFDAYSVQRALLREFQEYNGDVTNGYCRCSRFELRELLDATIEFDLFPMESYRNPNSFEEMSEKLTEYIWNEILRINKDDQSE
jgi:hypothetical protein